jgi:hypothetical protein
VVIGENTFGKIRRFQAAGFEGAIAAIATARSRAGGEAIEREKSMMYLTTLRQKRQGVSRISGLASSATFKGNERRHSVQVTTI